MDYTSMLFTSTRAASLPSLIRNLNDQLSCCLSLCQVRLGLLHAFRAEWIHLVNIDLQCAFRKQLKQLSAVPPTLFRGVHIVAHPASTRICKYRATTRCAVEGDGRRPEKADVLLDQLERRERRHGARGVAHGHNSALALDDLKVTFPPKSTNSVNHHPPQSSSSTQHTRHARIFPDAVKHGVHARAMRDLKHTLHSVLRGVQYDMVRAVRARECSLGLGGRRADHGRAALLGELREEEAEAPSNGVHENGVAALDGVGLGDERQRRQACSSNQRGG